METTSNRRTPRWPGLFAMFILSAPRVWLFIKLICGIDASRHQIAIHPRPGLVLRGSNASGSVVTFHGWSVVAVGTRVSGTASHPKVVRYVARVTLHTPRSENKPRNRCFSFPIFVFDVC